MDALDDAVRRRLGERLSERRPSFDWTGDYGVGDVTVDLAGQSMRGLALVELEWRNPDVAADTATLFRRIAEGPLTDHEQLFVLQVFSGYYGEDGDISPERANAEFIGEAAQDSLPRVTYCAVELSVTPPNTGPEWPAAWEGAVDEGDDVDPPEGWEGAVDEVAEQLVSLL